MERSGWREVDDGPKAAVSRRRFDPSLFRTFLHPLETVSPNRVREFIRRFRRESANNERNGFHFSPIVRFSSFIRSKNTEAIYMKLSGIVPHFSVMILRTKKTQKANEFLTVFLLVHSPLPLLSLPSD